MLRVALPNKGTLAEPAATMMREAGYRQRTDSRDLSVVDEENEIEFFYLRPKDIATYVGKGDLHLGVTGFDLMEESGSQTQEIIPLGFGSRGSTSPPRPTPTGRSRTSTAARSRRPTPRLVRSYLSGKRIGAEIVKLDGAVEISIQLGLADAIADVVSSGRTLRQHGLQIIGEAIATSQATLIEREKRHDRAEDAETTRLKKVFADRLQGVVVAREYLMMDFDCPEGLLEAVEKVAPGLQAPTVSPLSKKGWVAVRTMVRTKDTNA
ncbi:ATP phosphoribosyltransferase [Pseudonocardia sp. ICBG601]|uniref:ATP phosphoribosyltransferase n=1 Tax=Pseudonocardia sp. ICBG601 TaxID=2846759 RepID=UPI001CF711E1|nr:ATP phosphoribosyltransferase [Pseudonocardia sp. ICBG601]